MEVQKNVCPDNILRRKKNQRNKKSLIIYIII